MHSIIKKRGRIIDSHSVISTHLVNSQSIWIVIFFNRTSGKFGIYKVEIEF